jgi:hypothetical protein
MMLSGGRTPRRPRRPERRSPWHGSFIINSLFAILTGCDNLRSCWGRQSVFPKTPWDSKRRVADAETTVAEGGCEGLLVVPEVKKTPSCSLSSKSEAGAPCMAQHHRHPICFLPAVRFGERRRSVRRGGDNRHEPATGIHLGRCAGSAAGEASQEPPGGNVTSARSPSRLDRHGTGSAPDSLTASVLKADMNLLGHRSVGRRRGGCCSRQDSSLGGLIRHCPTREGEPRARKTAGIAQEREEERRRTGLVSHGRFWHGCSSWMGFGTWTCACSFVLDCLRCSFGINSRTP